MNQKISFNPSHPLNLQTSLETASKAAVEMKLIPSAIDVPAALNDAIVKAL
jgi:hypothetical protein